MAVSPKSFTHCAPSIVLVLSWVLVSAYQCDYSESNTSHVDDPVPVCLLKSHISVFGKMGLQWKNWSDTVCLPWVVAIDLVQKSSAETAVVNIDKFSSCSFWLGDTNEEWLDSPSISLSAG